MYAHFSDIKLNSGIRSDLEAAGHMIQNIHDGQAGAALDGKNPVQIQWWMLTQMMRLHRL